jgi:hypothetical protein
MRISTIAYANVKRRKEKAAFLAAGIGIGIGTVVALLSLSGSLRDEIGSQLDRFGANIVVTPHSDNMTMDYGGIQVAGVAFDQHRLTNDDTAAVYRIPYRRRLSAVAPKLLGAVEAEGRRTVLAGVDFPNELRLKRCGGSTVAFPRSLMRFCWATKWERRPLRFTLRLDLGMGADRLRDTTPSLTSDCTSRRSGCRLPAVSTASWASLARPAALKTG